MHYYRPLTRRTFLSTSAALAWGASAARAATNKKPVMLAGRPSHGPGAHEFNAGIMLLHKCLGTVPGLEVAHYTNGWPDSEKAFEGADGIFLFADGGGGHPFIQSGRLEIIGDLMRRGVGLMCGHYAVEIPKDKGGPQLQEWLGGYYETNWSCNPMWKPDFTEFPKHEITRGVLPFASRTNGTSTCASPRHEGDHADPRSGPATPARRAVRRARGRINTSRSQALRSNDVGHRAPRQRPRRGLPAGTSPKLAQRQLPQSCLNALCGSANWKSRRTVSRPASPRRI